MLTIYFICIIMSLKDAQRHIYIFITFLCVPSPPRPSSRAGLPLYLSRVTLRRIRLWSVAYYFIIVARSNGKKNGRRCFLHVSCRRFIFHVPFKPPESGSVRVPLMYKGGHFRSICYDGGLRSICKSAFCVYILLRYKNSERINTRRKRELFFCI